jgi:hypothetical protein
MSKRRPNRIAGQFAARLIEMLESPAFQALSLSGHRILARLEIELANHGGKDNGRLPVTFDDFQKYGIDRHAIAPAIREVEALGFAQITKRGRAGNAEWRSPNMFRLTYMYTKDISPTHEWRRIKTIENATMIAKVARKTSKGINRASAVPSSPAKKSKSPVGVKTNLNGENPHRNYKAPSAGNPHYINGGKTPTTLDISGKGRDEQVLPTRSST